MHKLKCVCGTVIPPDGDVEPQCRHCERMVLNRQLRELEKR